MNLPTVIVMVLLAIAQVSVAGLGDVGKKFNHVVRDVEHGVEDMFGGLMARQQSTVTVTITYVPSYCTASVLPLTTISSTATVLSTGIVGPNIIPTGGSTVTTVPVSTASSTAAAVVATTASNSTAVTTTTKATTIVSVTTTATTLATTTAAAIKSDGIRLMVSGFTFGLVMAAMAIWYGGLDLLSI